MKGNTIIRLSIADEITMNIWDISSLNPGQLIWSDLINFSILPSAKINILTLIYPLLWIWIYFSITVFLLFFVFLIWNIYSPPGILWKQTAHTSLCAEEQSLENQLSDEVVSCDVTVFFQLPLHSGWTSTNMDDCNLDKSYSRPCIRPSYLRPWPSGV